MSDSKIIDVARIILEAKLGSTRKSAQIEMCSVFAEALYGVLTAAGVPCEFWTATKYWIGNTADWYHAVVKVGDLFFDSMGLFDPDIVRARLKIHPSVDLRLDLKPDQPDCDEEFDELRNYYVRQLTKSLAKQMGVSPKATMAA